MSSEYGAVAGRIGAAVVIKGSVQMRKWWESSALCSCRRAKFDGAREQCHLAEVAHPAWRQCSGHAALERRERALGSAGVCWLAFAAAKEWVSLRHMLRCWGSARPQGGWCPRCTPCPAVGAMPEGTAVTAFLSGLSAAQHPLPVLREIPPAPPPPGSYRRGSWGSLAQPK